MMNSRRGFLAGLLALLPFAKAAQASGNALGTIRIFNGNATAGKGVVSPAIVNAAQYLPINPGNSIAFKGLPGFPTAVSVLRFEDQSLYPAIFTKYPAAGTEVVYSFYQVTDPNTALTTTTLVLV